MIVVARMAHSVILGVVSVVKMNKQVLNKVYRIRAIELIKPTDEIEKELQFTDSLSKENWPNRSEFVAFISNEGMWNEFTASQHAILKSLGANFDNACYTYTMKKEKYNELVK
jgi:hypothetical protein